MKPAFTGLHSGMPSLKPEFRRPERKSTFDEEMPEVVWSADESDYGETLPSISKTGRRRTDCWTFVKNKFQEYDKDVVDGLREELDTLLVFSGLFSAVVTAFLVESYKSLLPNETQPVVLLLQDIASRINSGNQSSSLPVPSRVPFSPSASARAVNLLWFFALSTSLFVALFSILIKQWLREYLRWTNLYGQEAVRIRQMRFEGLQEWGVRGKVGVVLPQGLQLSVLLFVSGLVIFLWSIDVPTAIGVLALVSCYFLSLIYTLAAAWVRPLCPYRSPILVPLRTFVRFFRTSFLMTLDVLRYRISFLRAKLDYDPLVRGQYEWLHLDRAMSKKLASDSGLDSATDPLNSALGWLRSQHPDQQTYVKLVECVKTFHSLPFVLDGGRLLRHRPQSLPTVLQCWSHPELRGEVFDPDLVIDGLRSTFLSENSIVSIHGLILPREIVTAIMEILYLRELYNLRQDQVERLAQLFWDLHGYSCRNGIWTPSKDPRAYIWITEMISNQPQTQRPLLKPPKNALDFILKSGCEQLLKPSTLLDDPAVRLENQGSDFGYLVFKLSILVIEEYAEDEHLVDMFRHLCTGMSWLLSGLYDVSDERRLKPYFRPDFFELLVLFASRSPPQLSSAVQPVIDTLKDAIQMREQLTPGPFEDELNVIAGLLERLMRMKRDKNLVLRAPSRKRKRVEGSSLKPDEGERRGRSRSPLRRRSVQLQ